MQTLGVLCKLPPILITLSRRACTGLCRADLGFEIQAGGRAVPAGPQQVGLHQYFTLHRGHLF